MAWSSAEQIESRTSRNETEYLLLRKSPLQSLRVTLCPSWLRFLLFSPWNSAWSCASSVVKKFSSVPQQQTRPCRHCDDHRLRHFPPEEHGQAHHGDHHGRQIINRAPCQDHDRACDGASSRCRDATHKRI